MTAIIPNNSPRPELQIFKRPARERWLELRKTCVTSTEMAPVSGIPKYGNTRYSIFHQKRGSLEDSFEGNVRSEVGQMIENGIAKLVSQRLNIKVLRLADFYISGSMGASFDYEIKQPGHDLDGWLCEIKNVDYMIFKDQWDEDEVGNPVPPDHITIQVQHQQETSDRPGTLLAVLVGGNDLKMIPIARDKPFGQSLRTIADRFWIDVKEGNEPDVVADDASVVPLIYNVADPNHLHDATDDDILSKQIADHMILGGRIKELESQRKLIKAEVLNEIGDAAKVFAMDGYTLDAGITRASDGTLVMPEMVGSYIGGRKEFRRFTVRKKKGGK